MAFVPAYYYKSGEEPRWAATAVAAVELEWDGWQRDPAAALPPPPRHLSTTDVGSTVAALDADTGAVLDAAGQTVGTDASALVTGTLNVARQPDRVLTTNGARPVGKDELLLNARDYGLVGNATTEDLTELNAAIEAAGGPVTVYFPRPENARYQFDQPLPKVNDVRIKGDGMDTVLRWVAGSMLAPSTTLQNWTFDEIGIENWTGASHLIDLGATGGLAHATFRRADLHPRVPTTSALHMHGSGNLFNVRFHDCKLWRQPTHTVPAVDLTATSSGCNSVSFDGGQWHSQGCPNGPFFRAENTTGSSYLVAFSFTDIVGEQNQGGLIHMYAANGVTVRNVVDHDQVNYSDDLFKFDMGGGLASNGVVFDNSGSSGAAVLPQGKSHLRIVDGQSHDVGRIVNAGSQIGTLSLPDIGRNVRHNGGRAISVRATVGNTTLNSSDHLIVCNGDNVTVTLPDPTAPLSGGTVPVGREYAVKNKHATASVTVASVGTATIDGSATATVAPDAALRVVTDGANWVVL